jgi:hypothetical protein
MQGVPVLPTSEIDRVPSSISSSTRATRRAGVTALVREDLCPEAIRLGRLLATLMPDEPEVMGLLALMLLLESLRASRITPDGNAKRGFLAGRRRALSGA